MKSKWLILFMVFALLITACGGSDTAEETVEEAEEAPVSYTHLTLPTKA